MRIDESDFSDTFDNVDFTGIFSVDSELREHRGRFRQSYYLFCRDREFTFLAQNPFVSCYTHSAAFS
jgi:hypothetical protein